MAENSLFAVLLRSPWWVSLLVAAAIAALSRALLPAQYVVFGALGAFPILVIAALSAARQWRAPRPAQVERTLQAVRSMDWRALSAAIEAGLRRDGFALQNPAPAGVDFEAGKAGRTVLVSARRWKAAGIGVEPLRALHAAVEARQADEGLYIGLGAPSDSALRFAREHRLRIVQGADLARLVGDLSPRAPKG